MPTPGGREAGFGSFSLHSQRGRVGSGGREMGKRLSVDSPSPGAEPSKGGHIQ